eukprot:TRINITY_DN980_c0_g3_i1.p1 TRINITY_DN980_c0_g3~~TRINITY_DN980_c0_g3_i1.p1  ORF type:complete len:201 (-),score=57.13 TRINITY_DN980_c0_g3_i1:127-729(-)
MKDNANKKPNASQSCKLVVLGDVGVGKSSILERFIFDTFTEGKASTMGSYFYEKSIKLDSAPVKVSLWDTAGQEKYASLASFYYKNADASLIVYDVSSGKTFERAMLWLAELKKNVKQFILIVLVGNKIDINKRETEYEEADRFAKEYGLKYFEVSAKEGVGVDEMFTAVASELLKKESKQPDCTILSSKKSFSRKPGCC